MWNRGMILALVALSLGSAHAEDSPADLARFSYTRDARTPAVALDRAIAAAKSRGATSIAIVLDRATFDPPPLRNEFRIAHEYASDRRAWLDAAAAGGASAIGLTTSERLRGTTQADLTALDGECNGDVWNVVGPSRPIVPAHDWVDAFAKQLKGQAKAIILVTGPEFPEHSFSRSNVTDTPSGENDRWRSKLADRGAYWDEEEIAETARRRHTTLIVIAPETNFGDCQAIDDLPEVPLATRPKALPPADPDPPTPPRRGTALGADVIAAIEAELRQRGYDGDAVARAIRVRSADAVTPPDTRPGGRFFAATADEFPRLGTQLLTNTDCPSGYGVWRLARAAAATGGAYVFYPFPATRWLDACERDEALLDRLAPPLASRDEIGRAARGDVALAAMLSAERAVLEDTPWTDYSKGFNTEPGGLGGWCGFELPGPAPARRWTPRRKPINQEFRWKPPRERAAMAARGVAAYDAAIAGLEKAAADPRIAAAPARSRANLRLCRFWFEMSRFHLRSFELATSDPVAYGAKDPTAKDDGLTCFRSVRLSDCLPAYDGRILTIADEERYGLMWPRTGGQPTRMGAFLSIPWGDPNYRSQRAPDRVFANLDARLRPLAERVVASARDVMDHEARSPWGWTVYYSELQTYGWLTPSKTDGGQQVGSEPAARPPAGSSPTPGATTPR